MKGIYIDKTGGPEVLQVRHDLPIPEPKDGEILVQNTVIGVKLHRHVRPIPQTHVSPTKPEAIGRVISVGPGETYGFQPGDRVVFIGAGAYAEYTAAPALHAYKVEQYAGELFRLLASQRIAVKVYQEYPLEKATRAQRDLESRRTSGKLLLKL